MCVVWCVPKSLNKNEINLERRAVFVNQHISIKRSHVPLFNPQAIVIGYYICFYAKETIKRRL